MTLLPLTTRTEGAFKKGACLFLPVALIACGGGGGGGGAPAGIAPIFSTVASQESDAPQNFLLDEVVAQRAGGGIPSSTSDARDAMLPFLRTRFPVTVETQNAGGVADAPTFRTHQRGSTTVLNAEYVDTSGGAINYMELINVAPAYAGGWTGKGVTVGILDTPLSLGHKELTGKKITYLNRAPLSTSYTQVGSHGTHVASLMAGTYNDDDMTGVMGVAYDADILSYGTAHDLFMLSNIIDPRPSDGLDAAESALAVWQENAERTSSDHMRERSFAIPFADRRFGEVVAAPGFRFLAGQSHRGYKADVIAFSAGLLNSGGYTRQDIIESLPHLLDALLQPWNDAASKSIIVLASGNSGLSLPEVPGRLPGIFPELRGHVLSVVSTGADGRLTSAGHRCGADSASWCIGAPGTGIRLARSTSVGDSSYEVDEGSSFAVPLVAGGLARDARFSPAQSMLLVPSASGDAFLRLVSMEMTLFDRLETAFRFPMSLFVHQDTPPWSPLTHASGDAYEASIKGLWGGDGRVRLTTERYALSHTMNFYRQQGLSSIALGDGASFANPYFVLMPSRQHGLMVTGSTFGFAMMMASPPEGARAQGRESAGTGSLVTLTPHRHVTMHAGYSDEGNRLLGMTGHGGFAFRAGKTFFSGVQASVPLGSWTGLGQVFIGKSDAHATGHHLIRAIEPLISSSFDVAIQKRGFFGNDQLMVHVHQPLRIERGAATLRYATWRHGEERLYDNVSLPLAPQGREIRMGVAYQRQFAHGTLQLRSAYIRQPHHHRHAPSAVRFIASFKKHF
ncbi:MAG: S8 family serine peptidase [Alphaproteobacteria bacterium GM7ARS4]|nr:S8 family serine peptidase [Alphaproteobacteria bacterium GM7ARS4]